MNQIDYKNGAELRANENVESQLLFVKAGLMAWNCSLKKKYGKLTGWGKLYSFKNGETD